MVATSSMIISALDQQDRSSLSAALLDDAAWLRTRATAARETAARLLHATRELIVKYGLAPALAGGNDERIPARSYMWIAPSDGSDCDVCGQPIPTGEVEYQIVVDRRHISIDRHCYHRMQAGDDQTPVGSA